jgi:ligand-binding sensor domain-containing protein
VDVAGRLWVGTAAAGLAMYDKQTDRFVRLTDELSHGLISALTSDAKGNLWIGTPTGLKYYDTVQKTMRRYTHEDTPGLPDNQIRSLLMDRAGNLWIGSATGLSRMRPGGTIVAVAGA